MKSVIPIILGLAAACTVLLSAAVQPATQTEFPDGQPLDGPTAISEAASGGTEASEAWIAEPDRTVEAGTSDKQSTQYAPPLSLEEIPEYEGEPYVTVNGNVPYFPAEDLTTQPFERYSPLDSLGRCGTAYANICRDTMPTAERGTIGDVRPSGWHTVRYDDLIDGRYLYNRCHLIAYRLAGENANTRNLITGTRYLNTVGMLPFEDQVGDYVEATGNHVLYRVTPLFEGENLLASGVLMEAYSVEDAGGGVCFNVYCYNVQPGIAIDYATGDSGQVKATLSAQPIEATYILNRNTKKFHYSYCSSVSDMSEKNKLPSNEDRETILAWGYVPCKRCNP